MLLLIAAIVSYTSLPFLAAYFLAGNDLEDDRRLVAEIVSFLRANKALPVVFKNSLSKFWLLRTFKYCLPRDARADIEFVIDDLREDIAEMIDQGWTLRRIRFVILVRSLKSIAPVVWGGVVQMVYRLSPVLAVIKGLSHL